MLAKFNVAEFAAKHSILSMELKDAVHRTLGTTLGTPKVCTSANNWTWGCIRQLNITGLWLFSYADLVQRNSSLDQFYMLRINEPYLDYCPNERCPACTKYKQFSFNEEFGKEKEKLIRGLNGLCLDCVSTGRESFRTNQCRIEHAV